MRQRVRAGPAPGKIIGKWVGHELEALGLKPSTSGDVPVPVGGRGMQRTERSKERCKHGGRSMEGNRISFFFRA